MINILMYAGTVRNINRNRVVLPSMMTFITTFRCNARCIMCDCWKKVPQNELDITQIEKILYQLPALDIVRLSGGEPFLRPDMEEIYEMCLKILNAGYVHITTNGFLTSRIIHFCEKRDRRRPLHLLFSIDGMEGKHNHVRGTHSAWKQVNETLSWLSKNRKTLNLKITVNQTIVDREGIDQYEMLKKHLMQYGIRNNIVIAYESSSTYSSGPRKQITSSQIGKLTPFADLSTENILRVINKARSDLHGMTFAEKTAKNYYYEGIVNRIEHGINSPKPACVSLRSHIRILPDGSIPVCQFNSQPAGNLTQNSFSEIWYSERTEMLRKWTYMCHGCWAECEILPNGLYSGDIFYNMLENIRLTSCARRIFKPGRLSENK